MLSLSFNQFSHLNSGVKLDEEVFRFVVMRLRVENLSTTTKNEVPLVLAKPIQLLEQSTASDIIKKARNFLVSPKDNGGVKLRVTKLELSAGTAAALLNAVPREPTSAVSNLKSNTGKGDCSSKQTTRPKPSL